MSKNFFFFFASLAWATGMTVEAACKSAKDRKEWRALVRMLLIEFHAAILAWTCVLSDPPSLCPGGYHLERGRCRYMMRLV